MKNLSTVILIFAFNRPYHLENLLKSLVKNKESKQIPLIFFLDGARNNNDHLKIKKLKEIIIKYEKYLNLRKINERPINIGSKMNILNGISESLIDYETAIVLEDDLIVDKYFLKYMLDSLKLYQYEKRVFHISGFSFFNSTESNETFFTRYMNCWGWATWSKKWSLLQTDPIAIQQNFSKKDIYEFNIENSHNFYRQIVENKVGLLKTWAIYWYATIFKSNGLCLMPKHSLVKNQGYDGSGERFGKSINQYEFKEEVITFFPKDINEDKQSFLLLKNYFKKRENIIDKFVKYLVYLLPYKYQKSITRFLIRLRFLIKKAFSYFIFNN